MELGDEAYATLLGVHRRLVREAFAAHKGQERWSARAEVRATGGTNDGAARAP